MREILSDIRWYPAEKPMRVFATSDLHVDYEENQSWVLSISQQEFRTDILIVAGDVSDYLDAVAMTLSALTARFHKVLYVPGNHELWVMRDRKPKSSSEKLHEVLAVAESCGASTKTFHSQKLAIVPLLGWYDYSFGEPSGRLGSCMDGLQELPLAAALPRAGDILSAQLSQ